MTSHIPSSKKTPHINGRRIFSSVLMAFDRKMPIDRRDLIRTRTPTNSRLSAARYEAEHVQPDRQLAATAFQLQVHCGMRCIRRRDQFHECWRGRLGDASAAADIRRFRWFHSTCKSVESFGRRLPSGYFGRYCPEFVRYRELSPSGSASVPPTDLASSSVIVGSLLRGMAFSCAAIPGGRSTLSANLGGIHASLPKGHK